MKLFSLFVCAALSAFSVAADSSANATVTRAELNALIERIGKLEAENRAQAKRIAELEGRAVVVSTNHAATSLAAIPKTEEGTTVSESGRVYTTAAGDKYFLADKFAGIFEPLSQNGLKVTPYGYLIADAIFNTHATEGDYYSDFVRRPSDRSYNDGSTTLSMQTSIFGVALETPESWNGWTFKGKLEFDLAGNHGNDYAFHWRHVYMEGVHESGWSILLGQTWHLWKIVTPNEIDSAWLENTGHPYRRSPQLRVTKKWELDDDSSLEMRVGVVKGGPGMGGDRDDDGTQDNMASNWALIQGALVYDRRAFWVEGDRRWLVGVGGMYGRERNHGASAWDANGMPTAFDASADEYDSQMILVAGQLPLFDRFTLTGQFFAGENLGGIQAGIAQRVAFYPGHRRGTPVKTVGGFLEAHYKLNDTWSFAGGYGFDNPNDNDAAHAAGRTYNDRAYMIAFYRVNKHLTFAGEYGYLTTRYADEEDADDHRIQFRAMYEF